MARKKQKAGRPWWGKRRTRRRMAVAVSLVLAIGIIAWLVVRGGGGHEGQKEFLVEPAPPFTLPTVAGEEFSLADRQGQHAVLLYFNEGMG